MTTLVVKASGMNFCSCFIHQWQIRHFEFDYLAGLWGINLPRCIQPRDSAKFKYQAFKKPPKHFKNGFSCKLDADHFTSVIYFFSFRSTLNYLHWLFRIMFYTETCINMWISCLRDYFIIQDHQFKLHILFNGSWNQMFEVLETKKGQF